jgi:hypothetical protein
MDHRILCKLPRKRNFLRPGLFAIFFVGTIALAACTNSRNYFIVQDKFGEAASAELQLCGKKRPLEKVGTEFKGQLDVSCEGSGKIVVRLKNKTETTCLIGYVTFGMVDTFDFVIQEGRCEAAPRFRTGS